MDGEARELRIRNLQPSNGNLHCLDCREVIADGLPLWKVYQEGVVAGVVHSLNGECPNGHKEDEREILTNEAV